MTDAPKPPKRRRRKIVVAFVVLVLGSPNRVKCDDRSLPTCRADITDIDAPLKFAGPAISTESDSKLRELLGASDPQTAIIARWELLQRQLQNSKGLSSQRAATIRSNEFARFNCFLEAKAGIKLPAWWTRAIKRSSDGEDVRPSSVAGFPPGLVIDQFRWRSQSILSRSVVHTPDGASDGIELLFADCQKLTITELGGFYAYANIACARLADKAVIALPPGEAMTYPIVCHDMSKNRIVWRQGVWGSAIPGHSGGTRVDSHVAQVLMNHSLVVVCGADGASAYCEGFSLTDGSPIFRFCPYVVRVREADELPVPE